MTIPAYLPYYVFTGSIAIILTIIYGLSAALANADWPRQDRTVVVRAAGEAWQRGYRSSLSFEPAKRRPGR
jgi:hypothetical protein